MYSSVLKKPVETRKALKGLIKLTIMFSSFILSIARERSQLSSVKLTIPAWGQGGVIIDMPLMDFRESYA